ncbi:MAG: ATP-binding protein, partial [Coriobacteriales bacterium]|nr:ATP-binding protein [Coriobacteriales bacterium]
PEIPEEVLREVIANAMVHREYSDLFLGQAVVVDIYPNRVEVTSPGGLWGGKTLENLADGISRCRNASLMRLSRSLPSPSGTGMRVEAQGSGIPMVLYEMRRGGLPRPSFEAGGDYFKVNLWRPDVHSRASLAYGAAHKLPARVTSDEAILSLMTQHEAVTARELAEKTGLKLDTVRGRLRKLVSEGKVVATAPASSRMRRYLLAS